MSQTEYEQRCPAEELIKTLSGKWKMVILHLTEQKSMRFSDYMRDIIGGNKQSIAVALRELEEDNLLVKTVITMKPSHIEYTLSEKGKKVVPLVELLYEIIADEAV